MKKSLWKTAFFGFRFLRRPGNKQIIIRPSRGGRQPGRMYAIREDDTQRERHFSRLIGEIIDRVLVRLSFALMGSQCDEGIVFPEQTHVKTQLAHNRNTVKLLRDYEKKISTMVTDKDPALASRLEEVCFLGIRFGQASVRTSEVVRWGSSGGYRTRETTEKQKSAHDRFTTFLRNEFDEYKKHLKKRDREKPLTTLVRGFRESIPALITALEAQDDAERHAFAKRLRGKAGIDSDGVMSIKQLKRCLRDAPKTK